MANLSGYNANDYEPRAPMTVIPNGEYPAVAIASEMKANSAGTGSFLAITWEFTDEPVKGRKLFSNLNLNNPSEIAVNIARAELSAICRAVGVMVPDDSAELHNIPLIIVVGTKKRKDTDEIENVIKGFKPITKATPAAKKSTAAKGAAAGGAAPWKKPAKAAEKPAEPTSETPKGMNAPDDKVPF